MCLSRLQRGEDGTHVGSVKAVGADASVGRDERTQPTQLGTDKAVVHKPVKRVFLGATEVGHQVSHAVAVGAETHPTLELDKEQAGARVGQARSRAGQFAFVRC